MADVMTRVGMHQSLPAPHIPRYAMPCVSKVRALSQMPALTTSPSNPIPPKPSITRTGSSGLTGRTSFAPHAAITMQSYEYPPIGVFAAAAICEMFPREVDAEVEMRDAARERKARISLISANALTMLPALEQSKTRIDGRPVRDMAWRGTSTT